MPRGLRLASAAFAVLALGACAGGSVTVSDTYCRDTFYWRTSKSDTEPTRQQADRHNSRRLCRCDNDCPKPGEEAPPARTALQPERKPS